MFKGVNTDVQSLQTFANRRPSQPPLLLGPPSLSLVPFFCYKQPIRRFGWVGTAEE